ncbi:MAG: outer membrane lipoprotein-sorting protein [Bacteroidetes bacterium]|nr:outer membrane lipoprotein-sorting protein [Bacteroidota bacterium]
MKKKLVLLFVVSFLGSMIARAQEAKLDDILYAYYKAIGLEKMKDWQTISGSGKTIAGGVEYPFKMITKRPGKLRIEAEIQGMRMIQAFDGTKGWSIVPWSGSSDPQEMTSDEIKGMKSQADIEGSLYNWKEKGHTAELIGKEDLDGSPVYKIKLTRADGDIENYFIDAETYLPVKVSSVTKIQGNEAESESYLSNYREFNGVLMASAITSKYKGQTISQVEIEKMEVDLPVSDSLFMKPVKK